MTKRWEVLCDRVLQAWLVVLGTCGERREQRRINGRLPSLPLGVYGPHRFEMSAWLFYKRLSLQSSDLDKISILPVLARKVRRSIILTEAVAVHLLTRYRNTDLHIFQILSSILSSEVKAFLLYPEMRLSKVSNCWWPDKIIITEFVFLGERFLHCYFSEQGARKRV